MGIARERWPRLDAMERGKRNLITDVAGVRVGHVTLKQGDVHTGVTAVLPHGGDVFHDKCPAAAHVINGFGKSVGLVQVQEMGAIETPLLLTNTLSVGAAHAGLVRYMLARNADIGLETGTVNPVVLECNDGALNDIRGMHITQQHALEALENASEAFEEGAVGAGTGMTCYSLKGGIGSASRVFTLYGEQYTLGALLLTNFGSLGDLTLGGRLIGPRLHALTQSEPRPDRGSAIAVLATDAPLSHRQLLRAAKRAQSGIARTGAISGNGSGEIALAFSTANRAPHYPNGAPIPMRRLHDDDMDLVFRAVVETVEESVISSLLHAEHTVGRAGTVRLCLGELMERMQ